MTDNIKNDRPLNIEIDFTKDNTTIILNSMKRLFKHNKLTDSEINNLLSDEKQHDNETLNKKITYSKKIFNLNYPLFKNITPNVSISKNTKARYYTHIFIDKYLLCKEWFWEGDNHKKFAEWLETSKTLKNITVTKKYLLDNVQILTKEQVYSLILLLSIAQKTTFTLLGVENRQEVYKLLVSKNIVDITKDDLTKACNNFEYNNIDRLNDTAKKIYNASQKYKNKKGEYIKGKVRNKIIEMIQNNTNEL